MAASMTLEEVQNIVNQVNGVTVDAFAELCCVLEKIPGIHVTATINEVSGPMATLATLFEDGQKIKLQTRFYPATGKEDYDVGFALGDKMFVRLAYGWFSDIVYAKAHPA